MSTTRRANATTVTLVAIRIHRFASTRGNCSQGNMCEFLRTFTKPIQRSSNQRRIKTAPKSKGKAVGIVPRSAGGDLGEAGFFMQPTAAEVHGGFIVHEGARRGRFAHESANDILLSTSFNLQSRRSDHAPMYDQLHAEFSESMEEHVRYSAWTLTKYCIRTKHLRFP